jgi:type VI secretion system secreted protein VgrG
MNMISDRAHFTLDAGGLPAGHLRVLSFRGREAVSRPFRFNITIASSEEAEDLQAACSGAPATLTMRFGGDDERRVCGVAASVEVLAAFEQGHRAFRLRLVPRLWLLGKRTTSRIFQDKTVPEIVRAVLDAAGIPHRWQLVDKYPVRVYCTQYQETDLAFVTRLLAEEGIFYSFEHGAEEIIVFSDSAHLYQPIAGNPKLAYRYAQESDGLVPEEHHVGRFAKRRLIKSGAVLLRGYDFSRPKLDLRADATPSRTMADDVLPIEARLLMYEHHDDDERPDVDGGSARVRLEQHRCNALVAQGASACRRLLPGSRFELIDHDLDALNGSYVLASVEHEGRAPEVACGREPVYTNTFVCVPAHVPLRPKRPERVLQQVTETAVVVGPPGEEIHTDEHGRVKVQFPWDLDGKHDEKSSCWIRVAQTWAGAGWGFQFIPRIGMEVVVTFLGGDTDRPLITGCLTNGSNASPFPLPASKTKSGIVTRSTPRGSGGNELSFEDAKGREEVVLHAERDMTESVGRNRDEHVGRDRRESVIRHAVERVGGDMTVDVGGALRQICGNHAIQCNGDTSQTIRGGASLHVEGSASAVVKENYTLHVAGNADVVVGTPNEKHRHGMMVHGDHVFGATGTSTLRAEKKIVLQCGKSSLEIGPDGVKINGRRIELSGHDGVSMNGSGTSVRLEEEAQITSKTLRIFSSNASLVLDERAKLKGEMVLLNCDEEKPTNPTEDDKPVETKPFKMKFSDFEYGTYANKAFHMLVDGATYKGTTDGDGMLEKQIPKDAKTLTIVVWKGEYPTSEQKTRTIQLDEMPPATTPRGALMRLANLGYYGGEPKDELDDAAKAAVRELQVHAGLPDTGELDEATAGKLNAMHGK